MSQHSDRSTAPRRPQFSRLDTHAVLCRQLAERLSGTVVASRRTAWHSATFAGARHQVVLDTAASLARLATLPDTEFELPGAFVADLEVAETEGSRVTIEVLVVLE